MSPERTEDMSSYSEGQTHQLVDRLEAEGFTPGHITLLGQFPRLGDLKLVLEGKAEIVPIPNPKPTPWQSPFLRPCPGGSRLIITACYGKRTIAKAKTYFAHIDSEFMRHNLNVTEVATPDTEVGVYMLVRDSCFADIYASIGLDLNRLVLTQDQILSFMYRYANWLRTDGFGTFFLMKRGYQFFVVHVHFNPGPGIFIDHLSNSVVWEAEYRPHFVLPQP